jgi:hypothetical protein
MGNPSRFGVARTRVGPPLAVTLTVTKGRSVRTVHMLAGYPALGEAASSSAPTG